MSSKSLLRVLISCFAFSGVSLLVSTRQNVNRQSVDDFHMMRHHNDNDSDNDNQKPQPQPQPQRTATNTNTENAPIAHHKNESISACLIIMDDNHFLIEWLAYHYHVLPMRDLIVHIDPNSRTSPLRILEKWKGLIDITVWNVSQIKHEPLFHCKKPYNNNVTKDFISRQAYFYQQCLKEFKTRNKTWVMITDTDEFVKVNDRNPETKSVTPSIQEPASVLKFISHIEQQQQQQSQSQSQQADDDDNNDGAAKRKCLSIPRVDFKGKELNNIKKKENNTFIESMPVSSLNATDLLTTRFLYWRNPRKYKTRLEPKVMINVKRLKWSAFRSQPLCPPRHVHQVLPVCPGHEKVRTSPYEMSEFMIHHYQGTLEQYTARMDPRNIRGRPDQNLTAMQATFAKQTNRGENNFDASIVPWIYGFAQQVGSQEAERLLQNVGKVGME